MIRLVQRNLIIPRGDTGTFSVPVLSSYQNGEIAVFSIINPMTQAKIYEKIIEITEETFNVRFEHEDTVNLPVGKFLWDIKIYQNPVIVEGELLDGTEVDSYYAAFNMPSCEIRQTGDNLLTADDAPGATLTPQQINAINAALTALTAAVQETESNVEHYPKIINEEWNVWDATLNEYTSTGIRATGNGIASIEKTSTENLVDTYTVTFTDGTTFTYNITNGERGIGISSINKGSSSGLVDTYIIAYTDGASTTFTITNGATPNIRIGTVQDGAVAAASITGTPENPVLNLTLPNAHVPTKVSQLENDAGYLTEHQNISGKLDVSLKGAANGLAELDENGKVPSSQLPSYVDDILEYDSFSNFPVTGEEGKIYVAKDTNLTYRWSGSDYIEISSSLALGETSSTAYRGDRGKTAYDHASAKGSAFASGLYKITTNSEGHVTAANAVEKSDITGLGIASENIVAVQEEQPTDTSNKIWIKDSSLSVQVPTMSDLPTKVSDLINDSGFISSYTETDPTVSAWAKATTKPSYTAVEVGALPSNTHIPSTTAELTNDAGFITNADLPTKVSELTNDAGYLTTHQDISGKANSADLATVATSGSYDDLINKPSIPTKVSELTDDSGHYMKPSTGIPASDLASGVIPNVPVQDVQVNGATVLNNGVANVPIAGVNTYGVAKASTNYGIKQEDGFFKISSATSTGIKNGANNTQPITTAVQHESVFYGLAKAAGDTTQSASSSAVGNYTENAKSSINTMLSSPITVSGTTPTITAKAGIRYVCDEVLTLSFTPSASGICDVIFESGSTPTVLTVPSTVKWPDWFDPTALEANRTYELNVLDGVYGAVGVWS